jgi:hypothetical protein
MKSAALRGSRSASRSASRPSYDKEGGEGGREGGRDLEGVGEAVVLAVPVSPAHLPTGLDRVVREPGPESL